MKDNRSLPVCSSKLLLSELRPLEHLPAALAIKRPSPDWNVKNADVPTLDKLVVMGLSGIPGRGSKRRGQWRKSATLTVGRRSHKLSLKGKGRALL